MKVAFRTLQRRTTLHIMSEPVKIPTREQVREVVREHYETHHLDHEQTLHLPPVEDLEDEASDERL
jgi:hypothetical protein